MGKHRYMWYASVNQRQTRILVLCYCIHYIIHSHVGDIDVLLFFCELV